MEIISSAIIYLKFPFNREVLPSVEPGYLSKLLPETIPEKGDNYKEVLEDINKCILPGITHWQSPNFHAYFPTATSFPSIVGETLSAGLGIIGFSWVSSIKSFKYFQFICSSRFFFQQRNRI